MIRIQDFGSIVRILSVRASNAKSVTGMKQLNITTSFIREFPKPLLAPTTRMSLNNLEVPLKTGKVSNSVRASNANFTEMKKLQKTTSFIKEFPKPLLVPTTRMSLNNLEVPSKNGRVSVRNKVSNECFTVMQSAQNKSSSSVQKSPEPK